MILTGSVKPMVHQIEDVELLHHHPRINVWNGLGTGKMFTGAWIVQKWWLAGMVDACVVVAPSMCATDWMRAFESVAWPDGLAEVTDARPPDQGLIAEFIGESALRDRGRCHVFVTSYGGVRSSVGRSTGSRYLIDRSSEFFAGLRGRKIAVIFDESQNAALPTSQQSAACRALSSEMVGVISMTATPIGNPLAMRLWGMTSLVRPDLLVGPGRRDVSSFQAYKARYGVLVDPMENSSGRFVAARAYPVGVNQPMIDAEVLKPMAPFSTRRSKEECLDLPPKVRMRRSYRASAEVERLMNGLVDDDRAILSNGDSVVVDNALEERLRTIELSSGWLAGRIVHSAKLQLLKSVIEEIDDNMTDRAPVLVWCSRTMELLSAAMVCAGIGSEQAQFMGTEGSVSDAAYNVCVRDAAAKKVGVIHGRTSHRDRDKIQDDWRSGRLRIVVAHPGVAGAGLNWQHVMATVYFSQPLGSILRQQSEDRVHRHGLKHTALYYDLTMENGPDQAVAGAHAEQASASEAMLVWLNQRSRSIRG